MKPFTPKILIVDDDPIFSGVVAQKAREEGAEVTICRTVEDLPYLAVEQAFDVAIIDLYLDGLKDRLKGTDLLSSLKQTPVVLISRSAEDRPVEYPAVVRSFVKKSEGADAILNTALLEANTQRLRLLAQV